MLNSYYSVREMGVQWEKAVCEKSLKGLLNPLQKRYTQFL